MSYQPNDTILGKYRIEALIGKGAFADVYSATHLESKDPYALKVLGKNAPGLGSTEYGEYQNRFNLEAHLGAKLNHPNIIRTYNFEWEGENLILVMEYASKGSLGQAIDQMRKNNKQLPVKTAVNITLQIANGLAILHDLDVVHRDLKPNNILINSEGQAKVADLGLAQVAGGPSMRSQLSAPLAHPGTPAYMSPEQKTSSQYLSPASDIFSVGLILFEMLTGRVYANQRPGTRASSLKSDVPTWLDDLLARMLDEDPRKRPWNGKELAELLLKNEQPVVVPVGIKTPVTPKVKQPNSTSQIKQNIKEKKKNFWITVFPIAAIAVAFGLCATIIIFWLLSPYFNRTPASESPTQTISFPTDTSNISTEPTITNSPTSQPTITEVLQQDQGIFQDPTNTFLPIPTEASPTETKACTLYLCENSTAENVCVYGISQTATQLIVTFKFQQINLTPPLSLSFAGQSVECELLSSYQNRIYCAGASISSSKEMLSLYSSENLICSGELIIPKYITPVPTPKKPSSGNSYP